MMQVKTIYDKYDITLRKPQGESRTCPIFFNLKIILKIHNYKKLQDSLLPFKK